MEVNDLFHANTLEPRDDIDAGNVTPRRPVLLNANVLIFRSVVGKLIPRKLAWVWNADAPITTIPSGIVKVPFKVPVYPVTKVPENSNPLPSAGYSCKEVQPVKASDAIVDTWRAVISVIAVLLKKACAPISSTFGKSTLVKAVLRKA